MPTIRSRRSRLFSHMPKVLITGMSGTGKSTARDIGVIQHHVLVGISDKDRKILWGRSGNRCALCRRVLVAERTSADGEAVVGDEAHIAARAPGGPRYGECSPDVVDSYENLILLCRVDHKRVDDQPRYYTTARLRQAKAEHEKWVEHALGDVPARPVVHNEISGTINGPVLQAGSVVLSGPSSVVCSGSRSPAKIARKASLRL